MTKDVEDYAIVGGIPSKTIKYRFNESLIESLKASQWWRYTPQDLLAYRPDDPEAFVERFADAGGAISPMEEIRFTPRQYLRQK